MPSPRKETPSKGRKAQSQVEARPKRRKRAFSSLSAAMKFLDASVNYERIRPQRVPDEAFKLDRMRALLSELEDPHTRVPLVHVAGSKGKGSVCEMLSAALSGCGYTVGLNTSPHLVDVRERVRIGGEPISESVFIKSLSRCRDAAEAVEKKHGAATYFELVTLMALWCFMDQAVDVGVVEVGLGGRLDATNVITPVVCGVSAIQLEHTELLGDSVGAIAREKAGIFKPGVPAISVPQDDEALEALKAVAEEVGAPLMVLGDRIEYTSRFEAAHGMGPHARVCVAHAGQAYEHLPVPLPGEHQAANCGLALALLAQLTERGFRAPETAVADGLEQTTAIGRLEQVFDVPRILVDGAHTGASMTALVKAIGAQLRCDSMVVIFGCAADKDVDAMLTEIGRGADKVIFTRAADNPRAADPKSLASRYEALTGKMAQIEPSVKDAINTAARAVSRDDLVCVTGSFAVAGEAKALLDEKKAEMVEA